MEKINCLWITGALLVLSPLVSVHNDSNFNEEIELITKKLSKKVLDFSFDIFQLMKEKENLVLSPFKINCNLAMLAMGARGNTLEQIQDALHLSEFRSTKEIVLAYNSLIMFLINASEGVVFEESTLYYEQQLIPKTLYFRAIQNYFHSTFQSVNFLTNPENAMVQINTWVEAKSDGKITNYLEPNDLSDLKSLLITGLVEFDNQGIDKVFNPDKNKKASFTLANGAQLQVEMMHLEDWLMVGDCPEFDSKVLRMNYANDRLFAYFILPNSIHGISQLRQKLSPYAFEAHQKTLKEQFVRLQLPQFVLKYQGNLSPILQHLNIIDVFSNSLADLGGIAEPYPFNPFVSKFMHGCYIAMNNSYSSKDFPILAKRQLLDEPSQPEISAQSIEFTADHPFALIISDAITSSIILLGIIDDPTK